MVGTVAYFEPEHWVAHRPHKPRKGVLLFLLCFLLGMAFFYCHFALHGVLLYYVNGEGLLPAKGAPPKACFITLDASRDAESDNPRK